MSAVLERSATFDVHGLSHRGVREHNEDSWFAAADVGLALVADEVGGHASGELASKSVTADIAAFLRRVAKAWTRNAPEKLRDPSAQERAVKRAIAFAHNRLAEINAVAADLRHRRGSTVVGIWAPQGVNGPATIFHVGDSRLYLLRQRRLELLTRDHSAYEEWLENGSIGAPPSKRFILQALGLSESIAPTLHSFLPQGADKLLLCSDGLSGAIGETELAAAIAKGATLEAGCGLLVQLGIARDSKDNLTAVLCNFA